ncbi:MAG: ferredoxin [Bacteroidetes bacterium]|nr:MAG: ferredoxin [Bacteroidota bacterium]
MRVRIKSIVTETRDAASFELEPLDESSFNYSAGQFITILFRFSGREIRRSYSLSSTPGIDPFPVITIKRVINGEISRYMLEHSKIGDELEILAPKGLFIPDLSDSARDIFLLAAGSGISPVFSILKWILHNEPHTQVHLFFQNHSEKSTIFRQMIEEYAEGFSDRFEWLDFLSNPQAEDAISERINNEILEKLVLEKLRFKFQDARFFICGPNSFMRMCQFTLLLMGFDENQLRREFFLVPPPPPPPLLEDTTSKRVSVIVSGTAHEFETHYPVTILDAALHNQIRLPYSCKTGRCAACVAKCISGKVIMGNNEVLTEADLEKGLVLTCVGYAESDLQLVYEESNS